MSTTLQDRPATDAAPEPGAMDPRFRARRAAVRAARATRRRRIALGVAGVAAAVGLGFLVLDSPLLAVREVDVRGIEHLDAAAVRSATGVETGDALAFVDVGRVREAVEALPWVADASVGRRWPHRLVVEVTEREPALWIASAGGAMLVDLDGVVVGERAEPPAGLVEITGVRRVPTPGEVLRPRGAADVLAGLPPALAARVDVVDVDTALTVGLASGPAIVLGDADRLAEKGAAALAVLDHLGESASEARSIDVRVPRAPAWCCGDAGETAVLPGLDARVRAPGRSAGFGGGLAPADR